MICGAAGGTGKPGDSIEKTKTSKADLQALADSFAACDGVYASMTDAKGTETAKFFLGEQPRISILAFNGARFRALRQSRDLHAHQGGSCPRRASRDPAPRSVHR